MEFFTSFLWPLIAVLRVALEAIHAVVGSYGFSIIILSLIVATLLTPISARARALEKKDKALIDRMAPQLEEIRKHHTGQERFERIDQVYQEHGYHPIRSMVSLLPLLVQLPFLLAALLLLMSYEPLRGQSFLLVGDLSKPDGLLPVAGVAVNVLPILLIGVTLAESWLRKDSTAQSRRRFLIVALVLFVLIYPAPSGASLYWLTAACFSLTRTLLA